MFRVYFWDADERGIKMETAPTFDEALYLTEELPEGCAGFEIWEEVSPNKSKLVAEFYVDDVVDTFLDTLGEEEYEDCAYDCF